MKKIALILAAVTLAALAAGCGSRKSANPPTVTTTAAPSAATFKVGLSTDIGGLNDRGFNHLAYLGLLKAQQRPRHQGPRRRGGIELRLRPEPQLARAPGLQPRDRRGLHRDPGDGDGCEAVPEDALRDRRRVERRRGQAPERRGAAVQGAGSGLPRRVRGRARRKGQGRAHGVERRRPEAAAGRPLHRRLPGRREGGASRCRDAEQLLERLHRAAQVQGGRAAADRGRLGRRLPGRGRLRPRRARRGAREGRVGHRRRRRPGLPRPVGADLGAEARRHRRLPVRQGREGRQVQGRHRRGLRPDAGRRRDRQVLVEGAGRASPRRSRR